MFVPFLHSACAWWPRSAPTKHSKVKEKNSLFPLSPLSLNFSLDISLILTYDNWWIFRSLPSPLGGSINNHHHQRFATVSRVVDTFAPPLLLLFAFCSCCARWDVRGDFSHSQDWYLFCIQHILTLFTSLTSAHNKTIMARFFCKHSRTIPFRRRRRHLPHSHLFCLLRWREENTRRERLLWFRRTKETSSDHKRVLKRFRRNNRWTIKRWFCLSSTHSSLRRVLTSYYRVERELTIWRIAVASCKL